MEIRTDRVGVLVDQLVDSKNLSSERLAGMTQHEYLWEPHIDMWSVRRLGLLQHRMRTGRATGFSTTTRRSTPSPLVRSRRSRGASVT